jgi:hypothetical protein
MLKAVLSLVLLIAMAVAFSYLLYVAIYVLGMLVVGVFKVVGMLITVCLEVLLLPVRLTRMALTADPRTRQKAAARRAADRRVELGAPCHQRRCSARVPAGARFCRRCGVAMTS